MFKQFSNNVDSTFYKYVTNKTSVLPKITVVQVSFTDH